MSRSRRSRCRRARRSPKPDSRRGTSTCVRTCCPAKARIASPADSRAARCAKARSSSIRRRAAAPMTRGCSPPTMHAEPPRERAVLVRLSPRAHRDHRAAARCHLSDVASAVPPRGARPRVGRAVVGAADHVRTRVRLLPALLGADRRERAARESARAVRGAITSEMYEDLNSAWIEMRDTDYERIQARGVSDFLDWVKMRSHLFRGVTFGTMLRDEAYHFIRLGTHMERADNTARILDTKYH